MTFSESFPQRGRAAGIAVFISFFVLAGPAAAAGSGNPSSDRIAALSPKARADHFAREVGHGCVGKSTFFMGMTTRGPAHGLAYWSLLCANGSSWAIQIDPDAKGTSAAVQCEALKQFGGKECFKKF